MNNKSMGHTDIKGHMLNIGITYAMIWQIFRDETEAEVIQDIGNFRFRVPDDRKKLFLLSR